jgi:hypothetical protein
MECFTLKCLVEEGYRLVALHKDCPYTNSTRVALY